jgi:putative intracellular protease/amidase
MCDSASTKRPIRNEPDLNATLNRIDWCVAAVCHAPGVLHRVKFQGQSIVKGKRVTGFTDGEEEAVHLTKVVPFLVEDELKRLGGLYEKAADWASFVITDGRLVTDQNPASSRAGAQALLKLLA